MSDQVDPITPPIADPQAVVDAALEPVPPAVTPVDPPVVPSSPSSVPMSDETPLAFVTPPASAPVNEPAVIPPDTTIPPDITIPQATIPPAPEPVINKPKMKSKILLVVVGFFALLGALGVGGYYAYLSFGGTEIPTISYITKFTRVDGKTVLNPNYDPNAVSPDAYDKGLTNKEARDKDLGIETVPGAETKGTDQASCNGCLNGGWQVWRNGECKITGICNSGGARKYAAKPMEPNIDELGETACKSPGSGGQWCNAYDVSGKPYAFCMKNDGSQGNCNNRAVELGYTIQLGVVGCQCISTTPECTLWTADDATVAKINQASTPDSTKMTEIAKVSAQCQNQKGSFTGTGGTEMWICPRGTTIACTAKNGKKFTGDLGCFCGVVQVDTATGHTSYSSTCGCDKTEKTTLDATTTTTDSPTMACTGLTRTPVTAPSVGQAVTFTCVGSVTPSTAGTLSYKYRYSLNSGAYLPMTSNVLTIAACGSYSVQCQACATLNGVLTCDPTWTGATP